MYSCHDIPQNDIIDVDNDVAVGMPSMSEIEQENSDDLKLLSAEEQGVYCIIQFLCCIVNILP